MEKALFGAGCFWGVESLFRAVPGVTDAAVGYAGGHTPNPTYKEVCRDDTGHAEVVEVAFDPARVSYGALVDVFFANHNPTQVDAQGVDEGSQYRSVIFTHGPEQVRMAEEKKAALAASGKWRDAIATRIEPAPVFWRAEEYHQRYNEKNDLPSCHVNFG